jgi:hypothetical protein
MSVDLLACTNCGCPLTDGELCNLTCRREWLNKNMSRVRQPDPGPQVASAVPACEPREAV